jgi:hypothetical protein
LILLHSDRAISIRQKELILEEHEEAKDSEWCGVTLVPQTLANPGPRTLQIHPLRNWPWVSTTQVVFERERRYFPEVALSMGIGNDAGKLGLGNERQS